MFNNMTNVYPVIQLETKYVWNDISESANTFYRSFPTDVIAPTSDNQALLSVLQKHRRSAFSPASWVLNAGYVC